MDTTYAAESRSRIVWERPDPTPRQAPVRLSREAILDVAMALADADRLDAVTIRAVAAELGAAPMRLYRYLATKDELLDLMAERVYSEIATRLGRPDRRRSSRATLTGIARQTRLAALRHEWFGDLVGGRPQLGPSALLVLDRSAAAFLTPIRTGRARSVDEARIAMGTLNAYVFGAVRREVSDRRLTRRTGEDESAWQATVGPYLDRQLASGRYPGLARLVREGAEEDPETAFEAGLSAVLDGLERRHDRIGGA